MSIIMVLLTVIGGFAVSAQSSVSGSFSRKVGTIESTLFMLLTGAMLLFILVIFFGNGDLLKIFEAPKWQLSAVFFGTLYGYLVIVAVPRIGVIATNILGIVGQLIVGMLIDHFGLFNSLTIHFDFNRLVALFFMFLAIYFIYKGNKRSIRGTQTENVGN